MYKVYRKGNYLHVIDLDNNQIWNATVDRASIEKMFDERHRYNFYSDYPQTAPQRFLDGIFLEHIVDENDDPWTLEDFEHFRTCKIGFYPIKPACDESFMITGLSAYDIAVENGFVGTEAELLESLVGADGADGDNGIDGDSAYEVAVSNGFVGTESEWLDSLVGADGADAIVPLTYASRLVQEGGDPPLDLNLINDDIEGVWTKDFVAGTYTYTKTGAFIANKTFITMTNAVRFGSFVTAERIDNNSIRLTSVTSLGVASDDIIDNLYFKIEIYP